MGSFHQPLLGAPDADEHFGSDVRFIEFEAPSDQHAFVRYLEGIPEDVHLGHAQQLRTYHEWSYHPQRGGREIDSRNPLATLRHVAEIARGMLPDVTSRVREPGVAERVKQFQSRGVAVAAAPPHLGGELLETAYRLRGFERFMLDLTENEALADYLLDQLTAMLVENAAALTEAGVDVLLLDDDVASCRTMLISPATWRRFFKERLRRVIRAAREARTDVLVFYHSDGNFTAIVPELVEIGVDVLNPLQPDCMDAVRLRRELGPRPAFWGTVGTARLWDEGRPEDIREEVRRRSRLLGPAGILLAPAYDLDYAPRANVEAFVEAATGIA